MLPDRGRRALLLALPAAALVGLGASEAVCGQPPLQPDKNDPEPGDELNAWIDAYGRPTASVSLNGEPGFQFMVDTGANMTAIAARHALALGLAPDGEVQVNGTTGSAIRATTTISRLTTGAVFKKRQRVVVMADDEMRTVDGILGADVFAGRRLSFNIRRKTVRVEASRTSPWGRGSSYMRVRNGMLAEIDGWIGRIQVRMMLDTGAATCIINPKLDSMLKRAYPSLIRQSFGKLTGVTGQEIIGDYIELPNITLGQVGVRDAGGIAVDAPIFRTWDLEREPTMIVGVNVLSQMSTFWIDYGARRFDAEPMAELVARQSVMLG
jgi:hypothetical protein